MNKVLLLALGLLVGGLGVRLVEGNNYVDGRLSACSDILDTVQGAVGVTALSCVKQAGEVYVTSISAPGKLWTLRGKEVQ